MIAAGDKDVERRIVGDGAAEFARRDIKVAVAPAVQFHGLTAPLRISRTLGLIVEAVFVAEVGIHQRGGAVKTVVQPAPIAARSGDAAVKASDDPVLIFEQAFGGRQRGQCAGSAQVCSLS